jgi:phosphatidate cytidylyltransferase
LLGLGIKNYAGENAKLLLFLVIVAQINDVLQYAWGKAIGKRKIAPNKTWEGFVGGTLCATLIGSLLWWATPFSIWQAALASLLITLLGFVGGLTMSAIKRDRGVKDYGGALAGHGGFLDRIDSICFAAPVFFHATRYFFT